MKHLLSIVLGVFIVATLLTLIATFKYLVDEHPKTLEKIVLAILFIVMSYVVGISIVELLV